MMGESVQAGVGVDPRRGGMQTSAAVRAGRVVLSQSCKQTSAGPTPDERNATRAVMPSGSARRSHSGPPGADALVSQRRAGHVDRRSAWRRRRRAAVSMTVPSAGRFRSRTRDSMSRSAGRLRSTADGPRQARLTTPADPGGRTSCRTYDVSTMSASPSRTSTR
jgi:hypothetical protein